MHVCIDELMHECINVLMHECSNVLMHECIYVSQLTTCDQINIKYIWGPRVNHMGPLVNNTLRFAKKVYSLNRYHFPIFIYYKETMKILVPILIKHCGNNQS